MVRSVIFALAMASVVRGQGAMCGLTNKCPEDTPCCSQYGACGVGAYCLGGCDPRSSFSLDSCVPAPVCQDQKYEFKNMDRIMSNTKYLGDPSDTDWVMDGEAAIFNDNVLLTMAADTTGTVLASSTYMWYGNVKARLKSSRGAGVVTAFILLSDVKDEIDYEFVGADLEVAQTNYYFQGVTNYVNGGNVTLSNTYNNFHDYEIRWTPDQIQWLVDGQVGRTKKRSDTWNSTTNQWDYPQTPSRVQLSVWPAGAPSNAPGTIEWAGGLIDWSSDLMQPQGYYYASFEFVTVECFNADSAPGTNKETSYTYNDVAGTDDKVEDGKGKTVLKSLVGTGTDMDAGESSSSGSSKPTSTANSVPGRNGATAPGSDNHADGTSPDASASGGARGSGGSSSSTSSGSDGFNQGSTSDNSKQNAAGKMGIGNEERVLKGSMFAGIVAGAAMMAL